MDKIPIIDDFRRSLRSKGQNLKWFYDNFINGNINLSYSGLNSQLNGYAPLSELVKNKIEDYLKTKDG